MQQYNKGENGDDDVHHTFPSLDKHSAKSFLQHTSQVLDIHRRLPTYRIHESSVIENQHSFTTHVKVQIEVNPKYAPTHAQLAGPVELLGVGEGNNKKESEKLAALHACMSLHSLGLLLSPHKPSTPSSSPAGDHKIHERTTNTDLNQCKSRGDNNGEMGDHAHLPTKENIEDGNVKIKNEKKESCKIFAKYMTLPSDRSLPPSIQLLLSNLLHPPPDDPPVTIPPLYLYSLDIVAYTSEGKKISFFSYPHLHHHQFEGFFLFAQTPVFFPPLFTKTFRKLKVDLCLRPLFHFVPTVDQYYNILKYHHTMINQTSPQSLPKCASYLFLPKFSKQGGKGEGEGEWELDEIIDVQLFELILSEDSALSIILRLVDQFNTAFSDLQFFEDQSRRGVISRNEEEYKRERECMEKLQALFLYRYVKTPYNNRAYISKGITFKEDLNEKKLKGNSYIEYYLQRWNLPITCSQQPLIIQLHSNTYEYISRASSFLRAEQLVEEYTRHFISPGDDLGGTIENEANEKEEKFREIIFTVPELSMLLSLPLELHFFYTFLSHISSTICDFSDYLDRLGKWQEKQLGAYQVHINNKMLLDQLFTDVQYSNTFYRGTMNYERLEFLGDSVCELALSFHFFFTLYDNLKYTDPIRYLTEDASQPQDDYKASDAWNLHAQWKYDYHKAPETGPEKDFISEEKYFLLRSQYLRNEYLQVIGEGFQFAESLLYKGHSNPNASDMYEALVGALDLDSGPRLSLPFTLRSLLSPSLLSFLPSSPPPLFPHHPAVDDQSKEHIKQILETLRGMSEQNQKEILHRIGQLPSSSNVPLHLFSVFGKVQMDEHQLQWAEATQLSLGVSFHIPFLLLFSLCAIHSPFSSTLLSLLLQSSPSRSFLSSRLLANLSRDHTPCDDDEMQRRLQKEGENEIEYLRTRLFFLGEGVVKYLTSKRVYHLSPSSMPSHLHLLRVVHLSSRTISSWLSLSPLLPLLYSFLPSSHPASDYSYERNGESDRSLESEEIDEVEGEEDGEGGKAMRLRRWFVMIVGAFFLDQWMKEVEEDQCEDQVFECAELALRECEKMMTRTVFEHAATSLNRYDHTNLQGFIDPKGFLRSLLLQRTASPPEYRLLQTHTQTSGRVIYEVGVFHLQNLLASARSTSKTTAELSAARLALLSLSPSEN